MATWTVIIERGPTSWARDVPALPGLGVAGATRAEVEQLIREAIPFHLEGLAAEGLPVPDAGTIEAETIAIGTLGGTGYETVNPTGSRQARQGPLGPAPTGLAFGVVAGHAGPRFYGHARQVRQTLNPPQPWSYSAAKTMPFISAIHTGGPRP